MQQLDLPRLQLTGLVCLALFACASPPDEPMLPPPVEEVVDGETRTWRAARLTNYTSYPEEGSAECIEFNGCAWAGHFAGIRGQQTREWVASNNIAAVHSRDFETYRLKTLRVRHEGRQIDVVVYDLCSDSDCDGCCTRNAAETGFLIDLEVHTAERFGTYNGVVQWTCLDC